MKWLKNFSFRKLFANKKFAVSFSVVLAFIFWLIIVLDQNPDMSRSFSNVPITINTASLDKIGLTITSKDYADSVEVSVNGPGYVVSALTEDDISIVADLSRIKSAGTHQVDLIVRKVGTKTDYEIVSVSLDSIIIHVDKVREKYVPITDEAPNIKLDLDFDPDLIRGDTILSEERIHIEGPEEALDKVVSAKAFIDAEANLRTDTTFEGRVKLYDANNNEIDPEPFTFTKTVNVTYKVLKTKTLNIVPSFSKKPINAPKLDALITLVEGGEKISTVNVKGPVEDINSLNEIQLEPIDFYQIRSGKKFRVKLLMPSDSVQVIDHAADFEMYLEFDISEFRTVTLNKVPINVINPKDGYSISPVVYKSLVLFVHKDFYRTITSNDVTATVDLSNASPEYPVQVAFTCGKGVVWERDIQTVVLQSTTKSK